MDVPWQFTPGALYIAGFAQARSPHAGLLIPASEALGTLVHIRIDRNISPNWMYQCRTQRIAGDMFLSSLLKLRDPAAGTVSSARLKEVAESVPSPQNDEFGECMPWVLKVVEKLHEAGLLDIKDAEELVKEFNEFAVASQPYARRDRFPNVAISQFCS